MLTKLEALNFRCLHYVNQRIGRFSVLVGANGSGKTTFLDVIAFMGDVLRDGPKPAIEKRTDDVRDLFWERNGNSFELAVEARIPDDILESLPDKDLYQTVRYELKIGYSDDVPGIIGEKVYLKGDEAPRPEQVNLFPRNIAPPSHIYDPGRIANVRQVLHKVPDRNDNYYSEVNPNKGKGWLPSFKFGTQKSALGNIPDDGRRFPVATWLRDFLISGVQELVLNSRLIRLASPPGQSRAFKPDGSNLPWVIEELKTESPERFEDWICHVQTAIPDITGIRTVERADDRHCYLVVEYNTGIAVPSWVVSDGTLRFLALTLLAYLEDQGRVFLIEEPENGIHPRAIEPLFQSLSSVYGSQVLLATHSPVVLGLVDQHDVLCFAKSPDGTDIVSGMEHPALQDWKGEANLGMLFASGILG